MHPAVLKIYEGAWRRGAGADDPVIRAIAGARHFVVGEAFLKLACETVEREFKGGLDADEPVHVSDFGGLPWDGVLLVLEGADGDGSPLVVHVGRLADSTAIYGVAVVRPGVRFPVSTIAPGALLCQSRYSINVDEIPAAGFGLQISALLSLINEPRIVEVRPGRASRRYTRRVRKLTGRPPMAWSDVSWTIGKRVASKHVPNGEAGSPRPLHWCRGHWRKADPGIANAQYIFLPRRSGWGWYTWVTDSWKGHPDFGIKLQRHVPRLEGEKPRLPAGISLLPGTKWEAMNAAQQAALRTAGYGPDYPVGASA